MKILVLIVTLMVSWVVANIIHRARMRRKRRQFDGFQTEQNRNHQLFTTLMRANQHAHRDETRHTLPTLKQLSS